MDKGDKSDTMIPPMSAPTSRSAAERMRAHRERRRDGLKCYVVQVRSSEIDELIRRGLLQGDHRDNPREVINAIHRFFDETLSKATSEGNT
jgi:hypothetical protein